MKLYTYISYINKQNDLRLLLRLFHININVCHHLKDTVLPSKSLYFKTDYKVNVFQLQFTIKLFYLFLLLFFRISHELLAPFSSLLLFETRVHGLREVTFIE